MDRLIYTALTGMRSRQAEQAVTANNLANASTTGFRRELSSLASRYLSGPEDTTRAQADDDVTTASTEQGHIVATGQRSTSPSTGRAGSRSRRRTAARPIPGAAISASARPACSRPAMATRWSATAAWSPCRRRPNR